MQFTSTQFTSTRVTSTRNRWPRTPLTLPGDPPHVNYEKMGSGIISRLGVGLWGAEKWDYKELGSGEHVVSTRRWVVGNTTKVYPETLAANTSDAAWCAGLGGSGLGFGVLDTLLRV